MSKHREPLLAKVFSVLPSSRIKFISIEVIDDELLRVNVKEWQASTRTEVEYPVCVTAKDLVKIGLVRGMVDFRNGGREILN